MGTVWRARDEAMGREVAVKEPRLPASVEPARRERAFARMRREATAAGRIGHPAVITLHDLVIEDGRPWLVMELVRGESLADRLASGPIERGEAARIGLAVLEALTAAHAAGVLHRDVKPANVLLGEYGRVVLTDFGIAQVEGEQALTDTGAFVGSPEFVAPELALGERPGPAADLWSLGVLLYMAIEGSSPFRRDHFAATLQAVIAATPRQPAPADDALGGLVMRLLAKRPGSRPGPEEIRRTLLREAAASGAEAGTATGDTPRPRRSTRRLRGWLLGAGAAVALATPTALVLTGDGAGDDGGGAIAQATESAAGTEETPNPEGPAPTEEASPDASEESEESEGSEEAEDWTRQAEAALGIELALPAGYTREAHPDTDLMVSYRSPDAYHSVDLWYLPDAGGSAEDFAGSQVSGYQVDTAYAAVDHELTMADFQPDGEAVELRVTTWDAAAPEGPPVLRAALLFGVPGTGAVWQLQLTTLEAEGAVVDEADRLFRRMVDELRIDPDAV
ncbi:serine/threonine protein kinase [Streptomyces profundus]|nr:serine/threonine protein kinase [Streptomyces sp. MA3_2.13]